jgi:diadenylate cyclase
MKLVDLKHGDGVNYDEEKVQSCISEIIKALQNMSKNDVGAIIVLSTGNVPSQILDSGVRLDCDISSELIESIFFPKTPLHDGAMIINGTKIVAAGCFLPLTQNLDKIPKDLGTRHRAGIGVTETIDVMSLIVSEESGIISVARTGKITRYADTETLKRTLGQYYWQELESARK